MNLDLAERMKDLEPEVIAVMRWHLGRFARHTCPVCEGKTWQLTPPQSTLHYRAADGAQPSMLGEGAAIPVVLVICETCFFVRQFAWLPILINYRATVAAALWPGAEGGGGG